MNKNKYLELLVEIAKLLKKYGPETFEELAKNLSSPELSEHLVSIITKTASVSKALQAKPKRSSRRINSQKNFSQTLQELGKTEPEKSKLLFQIYNGLIEKSILPTLREIQAFLSDIGAELLKVKSRDKAIIPFMKILGGLSMEKLNYWITEMRPVSTQDDRSLEGWSNIILGEGQARKTNH